MFSHHLLNISSPLPRIPRAIVRPKNAELVSITPFAFHCHSSSAACTTDPLPPSDLFVLRESLLFCEQKLFAQTTPFIFALPLSVNVPVRRETQAAGKLFPAILKIDCNSFPLPLPCKRFSSQSEDSLPFVWLITKLSGLLLHCDFPELTPQS